MDAILRNFREAQTIGSGTELSATLLPSRNLSDLRNFYNDTDERHIEKDIRSALTGPQHAIYRLTKPEQKAWIDVYIAFWRFTGELLACEDAVIGGTPHLADWSKSYNAWKEVTNALIKGYSGGHFQGWTLPCLYVVGKYLRIFAIKADEQAKDSNGDAMFTTGYQDDVMEESNKNEKLEDAARMLNRVFTLCISDRWE
ncbi:MAG: hypothetical protein M1823_002349 [Watsoniomyces obsoletus]|nr:MAG: hypothetical protein M1823_002349 [Watsoniomyces obsoletus]